MKKIIALAIALLMAIMLLVGSAMALGGPDDFRQRVNQFGQQAQNYPSGYHESWGYLNGYGQTPWWGGWYQFWGWWQR